MSSTLFGKALAMSSPADDPAAPAAGICRYDFSTMGTFAELMLRCDEATALGAFGAAAEELQLIAGTLTRFDPSSPIEQLNDAGGGAVGELLREVLVASLQAFHDSGGRVDVGLGNELIAAGYDRDFDELDAPDPAALRARSSRAPALPFSDAALVREPPLSIRVDGTVEVRAGARIDLGGIAKGWAADRICTRLSSFGSCLVNLGGDVAVHVVEGDEPWPIGIELPSGWGSYALAQGGVATSGQDRRAWRSADSEAIAHHLIDPRTGAPSTTDVLRISVFGASCLSAEVWSKTLLLDGFEAACIAAERLAIPAIVVRTDGTTRFVGVSPPIE